MPLVHVMPWPDPVIDTLGHDPRSLYVEMFLLPTLGPTTLLLARHLAQRFDGTPDGFDLDVLETSLALGLGPREGANSPVLRALSRLAQFDLARVEAPRSPGRPPARLIAPPSTGTLHGQPTGSAPEHIASDPLGVDPLWAERPETDEPEAEGDGQGEGEGEGDDGDDDEVLPPAATWHIRRLFPPVNRRHLRRLPPSLQATLSSWTAVHVVDAARQRARRAAFVLLETGETPEMVERLLLRTGFQPTLAREATEWAAGRHRQAVVAAGGAHPTPFGPAAPTAADARPPDRADERPGTAAASRSTGSGTRPAALVPRIPPPPACPAPVGR
jgi:hypothetical protein